MSWNGEQGRGLMAVLTIRAGKRYALRRSLPVGIPTGRQSTGLLIELSADGCRISNLDDASIAIGDRIAAELDGVQLGGVVRWSGDGVAGIRFERPLHCDQLRRLISTQRATAEVRRYGT